MTIRSHSVRLVALALLTAAQLHAIAHAAEHGVGEHEHEGVQCVYGTANDDDSDALLPASVSEGFDVDAQRDHVPIFEYIGFVTDCIAPPATGPPLRF
ncbi:MAG: hypothetical protein QNI99_18235 [Woeseiaceae bacterium]|nr:hypothetical protein [Woeseiaceae bacterium]